MHEEYYYDVRELFDALESGSQRLLKMNLGDDTAPALVYGFGNRRFHGSDRFDVH
jgi:hypothetical protein